MQLASQCLLKDDNGSTLMSWIDKKHAVVGKRVRLKLEDDSETSFFTVIKTYNTKEMSEVRDRSHDYTRTRKASDI